MLSLYIFISLYSFLFIIFFSRISNPYVFYHLKFASSSKSTSLYLISLTVFLMFLFLKKLLRVANTQNQLVLLVVFYFLNLHYSGIHIYQICSIIKIITKRKMENRILLLIYHFTQPRIVLPYSTLNRQQNIIDVIYIFH